MLARFWYGANAIWFIVVMALYLATSGTEFVSNLGPSGIAGFTALALAPLIIGEVAWWFLLFVITGEWSRGAQLEKAAPKAIA